MKRLRKLVLHFCAEAFSNLYDRLRVAGRILVERIERFGDSDDTLRLLAATSAFAGSFAAEMELLEVNRRGTHFATAF
jgi:hypothetical protein